MELFCQYSLLLGGRNISIWTDQYRSTLKKRGQFMFN